LLEELGIKRIVNATGVLTVLGGSVPDEEVLSAIHEASKVYVDMPELQRKAGEYIANLLGVEAAFVTSGAAAGLVLSMAACMTRGDRAKMARLPKTDGMKNEVIVQKLHRNMYDYNLELAGAKIVEVGNNNGTPVSEFENALGDRTAAVVYFVFDPQEGVLPLDQVIRIAHGKGVPVIADAAAENPPAENLTKFYQMGADIVAFSGGKDIGGLNSSGLLIGHKDLIGFCASLGPHSYEQVASGTRVYIGRPMKVSKEGIVGLVAALKKYVKTDHLARLQRWNEKVDFIVSQLSGLKDVSVRKVMPTNVDHPRPMTIPRVEILSGIKTPEELERELKNGDPPVYAYIMAKRLYVNPQCLLEGDEKIVASRLREILM